MRYHNLHETIEDFFRRHCAAPCSVCVAVSGGGDSVALLHLLCELRGRLSITRIGVAHVNHNIRPGASGKDAAFVRRLARGAGAAFHLAVLDKKDVPAAGKEEWARNKRYAFFNAVRRTSGYDYVATAHTADDQAETVLLRLMRGSGLTGLCGIAPIREDGVIRPLLHAGRASLRNWLSRRKLPFQEDSTNADISYARNWVRHAVLPLLEQNEPGATAHIAALAASAQSISAIVRPIINKWIDDNVVSTDSGGFLVKKEGMRAEAVAAEAIVSLLREKSIGFDRLHIDRIVRNRGRRSGEFLLPGGARYSWNRETVEFSFGRRTKAENKFRTRLRVPGVTLCKERKCRFEALRFRRRKVWQADFSDPATAFFDAGKCRAPFEFRPVKKGDRFWPFGAKGYVDCNMFLKKQRVPRGERARTGVVAAKDGEILWVVGLRTGHTCRITPETRSVLKISYKAIA
jgi:tRNA(Ile)-lysidine synthase